LNLFKTLSDEEQKEYRKWARENYKPYEPIKGVWHPIAQAECVRMNEEAGMAKDTTKKVKWVLRRD